MRGNNLFKIAQTRITGLTHWQIYVFSAYIFPYISFSKGCSSVAIETISSLFSLTESILGDPYCSFPGRSVRVSCPGVAKGKQRSRTSAATKYPVLVAEILPIFLPTKQCVIGRRSYSHPAHGNVGVHHDCHIYQDVFHHLKGSVTSITLLNLLFSWLSCDGCH